jgi:HAD superfamily hydrolase (TIGR01509 family)
MFDAVIFDLDGTLLDTESRSQVAGVECFAEYGIDVDPAFLHSMIGQDDVTTAGVIRARWPDLNFDAFRDTWALMVKRNYALGIPMKAGADALLSAITLPKALATSSTRVQCDQKLVLTGIAGHFRHTVTFDDVENAKPAPDPFLLAARLLNVAPERCLAFEDSELGAKSAHRAGMTVVQVPDILPASGRYAHLVAPDLMTGARQIGLLSD